MEEIESVSDRYKGACVHLGSMDVVRVRKFMGNVVGGGSCASSVRVWGRKVETFIGLPWVPRDLYGVKGLEDVMWCPPLI